MLFCPKCGNILFPKNTKKMVLACKCGYYTKKKETLVLKERVSLSDKDRIEVVEKKIETHPKTKEECPKCGHGEAYYWNLQTRAADEGDTRFFECTKCRHRWRAND